MTNVAGVTITPIAHELDITPRLLGDNMARFLGRNLQEFPESRPILQELLRTEQSRRIRQDVAEALAKPR